MTGPIKDDTPPSMPDSVPTKAPVHLSLSAGMVKLGLNIIDTTAKITAKATNILSCLTLNDSVQCTAMTVMMACVSMRGQNL